MANHFFQLEHRRLRERFSMETLTRHENRLLAALYKRWEWLADNHARQRLDDQFFSVTGHPTYGATREEGRAFRLSGMDAHKWIVTDGGHQAAANQTPDRQ